MFARLHARLKDYERHLGERFGRDISTPDARRAAWWHFQLMDHAFLRRFWSNFDQVAPGVFRANQPSPARLKIYAEKGIRSIVSLRGSSTQSAHLFEAEACRELGLSLTTLHGFSARRPPSHEAIAAFTETMEKAERPVLFHCKSGADRAGLASALYLLLFENRTAAEAARHLSWRYVHLSNADTGVLDHMIRVFGRDHARDGIGIRQWLETRYDPEAIAASFADWRKGQWKSD